MLLSEFFEENNITKSSVHLCVASKCYNNTDERIMYLSLPQFIKGQDYLVLSKRLASLIRKKRSLLLDAEIVTVDGSSWLILPQDYKTIIIIDESSRFAIENLLQKELIHSDVKPGDYLAINKVDYSAKFGKYEYKTVFEKKYDEYVGTREYPVGEKLLCPEDIRTHYLFDISEICDTEDVSTFILHLETIIIAYRRAGKLFSMIKRMIQKLLKHHSLEGIEIQLNLPLGSVSAIFPDQDNGYNPEKHIGEYYRSIEDLIYDEFEGEDVCYDDGSSSYVPSLESIEEFVIFALEDYSGCAIHIPRLNEGEDTAFLEWLAN